MGVEELHSYTLATYPFPEQHPENNIVEELKEVLNEYSISDDSVAAIEHDRGSNFQWDRLHLWRETLKKRKPPGKFCSGVWNYAKKLFAKINIPTRDNK